MEALPTMPMMAPQFRTSTLSYDNIPNFDFRLRMKEHILLTFNADPHEYDAAFDELAQMKFEANIPAASVEQILKLKRYYGQLCMMQKRFPMGAGEQLETPFAWHDGLVDMRSAQSEVTICDIEFEKASVMFNIGACHAQYAAEQPRDTQDSIKTAFSHFQQAATAFEQLNTFRNSDFFYPSVDLDANVITFYYNVLVAQAQECIVQKSLLENRNPLVTAKLSLWLQESYDSTTKIVDDWSINIPESVQRYYAKLCRLKSDIYGVIAYMALGDHYEKEDKKMGWRLQYYNIANKFMEHLTTNNAKMRDRYPELFVTSSFLFDVISAKQKNAEKENDFIYHDRIPKQEEAIGAAKKEGSVCKVTVPKFNPLDPSVCGADLFEKLLPSHIQEANNKYAEKKEEIYREMKEIIKSYDDHLNYQLQLAEFDKLRFMLKEGKNREAWFEIPEDLMQRNADMTSYPDCVPNLIEKMRESADTARVAEAKLNTLLAKLRAIDLPRLKADEGFNLIQKELERLSEHLQQAKANNVSLNKAIAQHSGNLQLLTLPCGEMWQKIVPMEEEEEQKTTQSPEEIQVRKMVAKVEEMQKQRHLFLEELTAELKADDIATKLMGTNERGAEEIMASEITKHATRQSAIRLNVTAQEAILRAFADANADYHGERSGMSKKRAEYEKRVNDLCASYEVYRDVARKCDEGDQFYRQLMARCDQFAIPVHAMEEQYREEMEKKERAKKEAEHHMNQLRMSREAQSALMDFGGPTGAPGPQYQAPPAPRAPGQRGPRLGDYLDSYRARKQNPQVQIPQEPEGPPSPTPSSICDFPSSRSQRFGPHSPYSGQPSPAYQYQPTPYQAPPPILPGTREYQQATTQYPGKPSSYSVPRVVGYGEQGGGGSHQSYAPSPVQGGPVGYGPQEGQGAPQAPEAQNQGYGVPQGYAPSPVQGGPGGSHYVPSPVQGAPQAPAPQNHPQYAPSPVKGGPGGPGGPPISHPQPHPHYAPSPVQGAFHQGPGAQYPPTSTAPPPPRQENLGGHQNQGYGAPPAPEYAPGPPQHQGYGSQGPPPAPDSHQFAPNQGYTPSPVQGAPPNAHPLAPAPNQGYGGPPPPNQGYTPSPVQGAPPVSHQSYTPSPIQGGPAQFQNHQNYAPGGHQQAPVAQNQGFQPPGAAPPPPRQENPNQYSTGFNGGSQGYPGSQQYAPSPIGGAPLSQNQGYGGPIPPLQPSYQPLAPPAQPVYQHPPLGAPISAPAPPTQQHQHVAPTPPPAPPPAQAPPPQKFTPAPGAPSPWHATPAELKTPWNTAPQYHAPQASSGSSGTSGGAPVPPPPAQSTSSNVDLLSDLLGDFNLQPPIQPTMQSSQHLQQTSAPLQAPQQAPQQAPPQFQQPITHHQDFRVVTSNQPDPPQQPQQKQFIRPAAAVQPMPQQTPELSQIAQQSAQNATETPILMKGAPNIAELSDPTKFELGEGNAQKLEKRLLHQSFRTNGPPPPMNQADPLNQIDAFSFLTRQK